MARPSLEKMIECADMNLERLGAPLHESSRKVFENCLERNLEVIRSYDPNHLFRLYMGKYKTYRKQQYGDKHDKL